MLNNLSGNFNHSSVLWSNTVNDPLKGHIFNFVLYTEKEPGIVAGLLQSRKTMGLGSECSVEARVTSPEHKAWVSKYGEQAVTHAAAPLPLRVAEMIHWKGKRRYTWFQCRRRSCQNVAVYSSGLP